MCLTACCYFSFCCTATDAGQDTQQDRTAPGAQGAKGVKSSSGVSPEMDKLKICKEDFEASKLSFQQVRGD